MPAPYLAILLLLAVLVLFIAVLIRLRSAPGQHTPLVPSNPTETKRQGVMTVLLIEIRGLHDLLRNVTIQEYLARFQPFDNLICQDIIASGVVIQQTQMGVYLCRFGTPGETRESNATRAIQLAHQLLRHNDASLTVRVSISTGLCAFPSNGLPFLMGLPVLRVEHMCASRTHAPAPILVDPETLTAASLTPTSPGVTPFTLPRTDKGPELPVYGLNLLLD